MLSGLAIYDNKTRDNGIVEAHSAVVTRIRWLNFGVRRYATENIIRGSLLYTNSIIVANGLLIQDNGYEPHYRGNELLYDKRSGEILYQNITLLSPQQKSEWDTMRKSVNYKWVLFYHPRDAYELGGGICYLPTDIENIRTLGRCRVKEEEVWKK